MDVHSRGSPHIYILLCGAWRLERKTKLHSIQRNVCQDAIGTMLSAPLLIFSMDNATPKPSFKRNTAMHLPIRAEWITGDDLGSYDTVF